MQIRKYLLPARFPFSPPDSEGGELASLRWGVTRRGVTNLLITGFRCNTISQQLLGCLLQYQGLTKLSHPSGISDHSIGRWKNICRKKNECNEFFGIAFSKFSDEVKICCIEISLSGKYLCKPGGTLTRRLSQVRETPFPGASPFQDTPGYCITF